MARVIPTGTSLDETCLGSGEVGRLRAEMLAGKETEEEADGGGGGGDGKAGKNGSSLGGVLVGVDKNGTFNDGGEDGGKAGGSTGGSTGASCGKKGSCSVRRLREVTTVVAVAQVNVNTRTKKKLYIFMGGLARGTMVGE